jgi:hypothetical protein
VKTFSSLGSELAEFKRRRERDAGANSVAARLRKM